MIPRCEARAKGSSAIEPEVPGRRGRSTGAHFGRKPMVRVLLDVIATSHGDQAMIQPEVQALRRLVQVLERQIKRQR